MTVASEASDTVVVTGAAGFIGFHVSRLLLELGRRVVGIDRVDSYYDPALKEARLARLAAHPAFSFERLDLADDGVAAAIVARHAPRTVVHLAAQPGVRHSLVDPGAYGRANLTGFLNVLEACRHQGVGHLVYASSSSVYGANDAMPFRTADPVDHPLSLYGATKRANELMAHSYSSLFGLPTTGLRFFTVYGPWGRPDMAVFLFVKAILEGRPIELFNDGRMSRDFTYVDDVAEAVATLCERPPAPDPGWRPGGRDPSRSAAPFRLYNVGGDAPVAVGDLVALIERELGREAEIVLRPMQPGDALASRADVDDLARATGVRPSTPLAEGVRRFVAWYRDFHRV